MTLSKLFILNFAESFYRGNANYYVCNVEYTCIEIWLALVWEWLQIFLFHICLSKTAPGKKCEICGVKASANRSIY